MDGLLLALRGFLDAIGDQRDDVELAGLSGLAFRLDVDDVIAAVEGTPEGWAATFVETFARLDLAVATYVHDAAAPGFASVQAEVEERLAEETDATWPALAWGVHPGAWGLVLGAHPGGLAIRGPLPGGPLRLAPGRLGLGAGGTLAVALPVGGIPSSPETRDVAALRAAAAGLTGLVPRTGAIESGARAWRAWRAALDAGTIHPGGHAVCAAITLERRARGAAFLARVGPRLADGLRLATDATAVGAAAEAVEAALLDAEAALRRGVDALAELSASWPAPPSLDASLGAAARATHTRLIDAARAADDEAARAILRALAAMDAAVAARLIVDRAPSPDALFACVADVPLEELDREADTLRPLAQTPRLVPLLLREGERVVAHAYVAELSASGAAVTCDVPALYLSCVWVAEERRGRGVGRRLATVLVDEARRRGARVILVEATTQPVFLHHAGYEALGFTEVDRDGDARRLLALAVGGDKKTPPPEAHLLRPAEVPRRGKLPVVVAVGRPCPLLLRGAHNVLAAARACADAGAPLTVAESTVAPYVTDVGGQRLPLGYVPEDAARAALVDASDAWVRDQ